MNANPYCCPQTKAILETLDSGLVRADGFLYPYLNADNEKKIPVFVDEKMLSGGDKVSRAMYRKDDAESTYENFLAWLFQTFDQDEVAFRNSLIQKLNLKDGDRVLVTGCGLGDDIECIFPKIGVKGKIFAQDISDLMVAATARKISGPDSNPLYRDNLHLSVSNASLLPYQDSYFDAAFHFGGINLFSDMEAAIHEMARVVKTGGKVVIGDEGVAPWLQKSEYGKIAICNNKLWESEAPLTQLPPNAASVNLTWVLGNCFYVIDFEVASSLPFMNIDIPHKGTRGGSMRKRYFGLLEGVAPTLKAQIELAATNAGTSRTEWLEQVLTKALADKG